MSKLSLKNSFILLTTAVLVVSGFLVATTTKVSAATPPTLEVYQTTLGDPSGTPIGNVMLSGSATPFLTARDAAIAGTLTSRTTYTPAESSVWGAGGAFGGELYMLGVIKNIPVNSLLKITKSVDYKDAETPDWTPYDAYTFYYPMETYSHGTFTNANGYLTKFDCSTEICTFVTSIGIGEVFTGGTANNPPIEISDAIGFQLKQTLGAEVITGDWNLTGQLLSSRGYRYGTGYTGDIPVIIGSSINTSTVPSPSTVYIDPSYTTASCGSHDCYYDAFPTIQKGIDVVATGGTINVATGTYNESQIVIDKALTLQGDTTNPDNVIIDGGNAALTTTGLIRITADGNVTVKGFTIKKAGGPDKDAFKVRVGVYAESSDAEATYTVSNNNIYGTNNADEEEDYGFYANSGQESIVFSHNTITQTGGNAVLVENNVGAVEISNNTLDEGVYGSTAVFVMTSGIDVTTLQKVTGNIIDVGTGNFDDASWTSGGITFSSAYDGTTGTFTNVEITDNRITNLLAHRRGISLVNNSSNGTAGEISNFTITGNTVTGTGATDSIGINLSGLISGENIQNNKLSNSEKGLISLTSAVVAENNWWGSAVLADVAAKISGNVTFKPYYITDTVGDSGILSNITAITAFSIPTQVGDTTISESAHTINLTMPYGTDVTTLIPTITTNTGASVNLASLVANNFTGAQTYTVTSVDGENSQNYIVTVTILSSGGSGGGGSYISTTFSAVTPPAVTKSGDANGDGKVDELDFSLLMSQWGQTGSGLSGDLNKDGTVDELDFSLLIANWGL